MSSINEAVIINDLQMEIQTVINTKINDILVLKDKCITEKYADYRLYADNRLKRIKIEKADFHKRLAYDLES